MKKQPLTSFIVNCYNGEKYLKRALKSIINQTYENWELIFWDNCSTDNSKIIFESFNNSKFRYFKSKSNVSLGQARAWAVEQCKGEYIAFLDVDDEWYPEKTKTQVKIMIDDSSVLSYSNVKEIYDNNKFFMTKTRWKTGYIFPNQLRQFEINLPTAMILRKKLIQKKLNFDPNIQASEEYCLFMQLIYNEKVSVIKKFLAKYYIRRDSLTNMKSHLWSKERLYTLNKIKSRYPLFVKKYPNELNEAKNRAEYYRARDYMFKKDIKNALQTMKKIRKSNWRYYILYILLVLSPRLWVIVHDYKTKRG